MHFPILTYRENNLLPQHIWGWEGVEFWPFHEFSPGFFFFWGGAVYDAFTSLPCFTVKTGHNLPIGITYIGGSFSLISVTSFNECLYFIQCQHVWFSHWEELKWWTWGWYGSEWLPPVYFSIHSQWMVKFYVQIFFVYASSIKMNSQDFTQDNKIQGGSTRTYCKGKIAHYSGSLVSVGYLLQDPHGYGFTICRRASQGLPEATRPSGQIQEVLESLRMRAWHLFKSTGAKTMVKNSQLYLRHPIHSQVEPS